MEEYNPDQGESLLSPEQILIIVKRLASDMDLELNEGHFNTVSMQKACNEVIPKICEQLRTIESFFQAYPSKREKAEELESIIQEFTEKVKVFPKTKSEFTAPFMRVVRFEI